MDPYDCKFNAKGIFPIGSTTANVTVQSVLLQFLTSQYMQWNKSISNECKLQILEINWYDFSLQIIHFVKTSLKT